MVRNFKKSLQAAEYLKIIQSEEQNFKKNENERRKPTQLWDKHTHTYTHTLTHTH